MPSAFRNLSNLKYLNLSASNFYGGVPGEILELSRLVSLDLSGNSLWLHKPSFTNLVQKLNSLEVLSLSQVNIYGSVPQTVANLTSLTTLFLSECGLLGEFPRKVFQLPKLQFLNLGSNPDLTGNIPDFRNGSSLEMFSLSKTSFSGAIPCSIDRLKFLKLLIIDGCQFSGSIPSSLGNLTNLHTLSLASNKFSGEIPESLSRLVNLHFLSLSDNHLSGRVYLDSLKSLTFLNLRGNDLSIVSNNTGPQLRVLILPSCNLRKFPTFLQKQDGLEALVLADNGIHGKVPEWMLNISKESLLLLNLGSNFLIGFESKKLPIVLPWTNLLMLELPFNLLEGPLPIPPPSISTYDVYHNRLTGEIPNIFCNLTSVSTLDLSSNGLSGMLPGCLGNMKNSPLVLNFENNKFHGEIPQIFMEGCNLRMIDFSQNQLSGKVPKSLVNCTMLEYLNLRGNLIDDTFPYWLGSMAMLRVLILGSNRFYGEIDGPKVNFEEFPMLQIVDLSSNGFSGKLPEKYLQLWNAMKIYNTKQLKYLEVDTSYKIGGYVWVDAFEFSMVIDNKGTETFFEKIQEFLVTVDFSRNQFEGEIPDVIGNLKAVRLLNLSNNILTGQIPLSLENLSELESLDLSHNELSGEIPQQLAELTFLGTLDVSYNRLSGHVPQGQQFSTFPNSSFEGNPGLCGTTLLRKCEDRFKTSSSEEESDCSDSVFFEFGWRVVAMGFGSGAVIGLTSGYFFVKKQNGWFAKIFGNRQFRKRNRRGYIIA